MLEYSGKVVLVLLILVIGWWLINILIGWVGGLFVRCSVDCIL